MKVGDIIYKYDPTHRVYVKGDSAPVYREFWVETKIIGETSRSWLAGYDFNPDKIAKKELAAGKLTGYKLTKQEVDENVFIHTHRHKIVDAIQYCRDYKTLKAVADAIGYKS